MPDTASSTTQHNWHGKVAVVTVTYGKRWHYLQQVIARLLQDQLVGPIVVIDNAAEDRIAEQVQTQGWNQRVSVIEMGENSGSAKGYKVGIAKAVKFADIEFIYLLDDDNLPDENAISELLNGYSKSGLNWKVALLSLRPDRPEYVNAAKTGQPLRHIKNSFLGFHVMNAIRKITGQSNKKSSFQAQPVDSVEVDYAPYGGFLMHKKWVEAIGLPDEDYYLYADDHEYTSRIPVNGGKILLCPNSRVIDIETSWHLQANNGAPPLFSKNSSEFRIFYSVRNRVTLERRFLITNNFVYLVNIFVSLLARSFLVLLKEKDFRALYGRSRLLYSAIKSGFVEKLGRVNFG